VLNTFNLQCLQTGARVATIFSGKRRGTRNTHSVSTTRGPVVEHRSETDWLTTAVEIAAAWNDTWWHSDVVVVFVPPAAEVSCFGIFLLAVRCWQPTRSWSVSHRDGWEAVLLVARSPVLDLQQSGRASSAGHQHRQGWQSADASAQTGARSAQHFTFTCERRKFCLHEAGTAPPCYPWCPVSAPGSCSPTLSAAKARTG